ncbi:MAG: hypothetical protein CMM44_06470 [Rhodospirillaceae bacterium]|nr:hypothetical protein [Rhodospirillaceae bacterium]
MANPGFFRLWRQKQLEYSLLYGLMGRYMKLYGLMGRYMNFLQESERALNYCNKEFDLSDRLQKST